MAKGQKRSNREIKKPKSDKKKAAPAASPLSSPHSGARRDQGRTGKNAR